MAKSRLVNLNATGGAFVTISATQITRRVEIIEDASANAGVKQGLIYQWLFDNFAATYQAAGGDEPIVLQDPLSQGRGQGPIIGQPAQTFPSGVVAATPLIKLTSASASTTTVRVIEFD